MENINKKNSDKLKKDLPIFIILGILCIIVISVNMMVRKSNKLKIEIVETEISYVRDVLGVALKEYYFENLDNLYSSPRDWLLNKGYLVDTGGYIKVNLDKIKTNLSTGKGISGDIYVLEDDEIVYYDEKNVRNLLLNIRNQKDYGIKDY